MIKHISRTRKLFAGVVLLVSLVTLSEAEPNTQKPELAQKKDISVDLQKTFEKAFSLMRNKKFYEGLELYEKTEKLLDLKTENRVFKILAENAVYLYGISEAAQSEIDNIFILKDEGATERKRDDLASSMSKRDHVLILAKKACEDALRIKEDEFLMSLLPLLEYRLEEIKRRPTRVHR